ncbi:cupin domain-containing protein [Streptomyces sp. NPDC005202]|uniref:JmjC domain-containing protein n=1 Tax=Streptomyces sp. NPDC005202 TaxID=3157021 RepID=UPI0033A04FCB
MIPFFASVTRAIQQETGYSNYVHAFLTPAGQQGLLHHWDQQMALIVQVAGAKTWQLWKPVYDSPMREYQESFRVGRKLPDWEAAGPDMSIDLKAGQTLLLPRGWVHNPHALDHDEPSVHLTFAIRERTPLWLAEQLTRGLIDDPEFRRIVLPSVLTGAGLGEELEATRAMLIEHLQGLALDALVDTVRRATLTELEYTT